MWDHLHVVPCYVLILRQFDAVLSVLIALQFTLRPPDYSPLCVLPQVLAPLFHGDGKGARTRGSALSPSSNCSCGMHANYAISIQSDSIL